MNLEDHLGDIIGKARAMSGVSAGAAAKAAGLTEAELAMLEDIGPDRRSGPNLAALAGLIGLDAVNWKALPMAGCRRNRI